MSDVKWKQSYVCVTVMSKCLSDCLCCHVTWAKCVKTVTCIFTAYRQTGAGQVDCCLYLIWSVLCCKTNKGGHANVFRWEEVIIRWGPNSIVVVDRKCSANQSPSIRQWSCSPLLHLLSISSAARSIDLVTWLDWAKEWTKSNTNVMGLWDCFQVDNKKWGQRNGKEIQSKKEGG